TWPLSSVMVKLFGTVSCNSMIVATISAGDDLSDLPAFCASGVAGFATGEDAAVGGAAVAAAAPAEGAAAVGAGPGAAACASGAGAGAGGAAGLLVSAASTCRS